MSNASPSSSKNAQSASMKVALIDDLPADASPYGQLPRDVVPRAYTIELGVAPEAERFTGRVQIAVTLTSPQNRVFLHGAGLQVSEAVAEVGGEQRPARYAQVNEDGLAALSFDAPLPAGNAILSLRYEAPFDDSLKGLYRVEHRGSAYAFTQFEPYSARMAFPCFDEPSFKTPFDLVLTVPAAHTAVANTPVLSEEPVDGGYRRVRFKTTEPLPTYLVAIAVGPFDVATAVPLAENAVRTHTVPFRGVAPRGQGALLAFALSETPPMVAELERYFEIPYPYEKLDVIAVPDFAAGAMENAGAITFRDYLLLLDPESAPESQKRAFAYVMAHELAHQWFGNLVTMPWWDDLWLNEAFATWMGYAVVDRLWPAQRASLSLLRNAHDAMEEDSLLSARMIRQPIESTHDISSAFDAITYSKGGAVLAMFEHYLGTETFRKGVSRYLNDHRFGNATADDLLAALSQEAGQDVSEPFNTFLEQAGVPLITADVRCDDEGHRVQLSQGRYLPIGSAGSRERTWEVPVCLRYGAGDTTHERCVMLSKQEQVLSLPQCPEWVIPNADAMGYYLWSLESQDLSALREHGFPQLNVREQMSFAKALEAAFESGALPADAVLGSLEPLVRSRERSVAVAPIPILEFVHAHVLSGESRARLSQYGRALYRPTVERLGLTRRPGEDGDQALLRAEVFRFMVEVVEDAALRRRLGQLGRKALIEPGVRKGDVSADLLRVAGQVAMQDAKGKLFDRVRARFAETDDPLSRSVLLSALSSVRDDRSARALALALDPAVRVNEVLPILAGQFAAEDTREAAWQFVVDNFEALRERVSTRSLGRLPLLTTGFCSKAHATRLQAFFGPKIEALAGGPRALTKAVEALSVCEAQAEAQRQSAVRFFSEQVGRNGDPPQPM